MYCTNEYKVNLTNTSVRLLPLSHYGLYMYIFSMHHIMISANVMLCVIDWIKCYSRCSHARIYNIRCVSWKIDEQVFICLYILCGFYWPYEFMLEVIRIWCFFPFTSRSDRVLLSWPLLNTDVIQFDFC